MSSDISYTGFILIPGESKIIERGSEEVATLGLAHVALTGTGATKLDCSIGDGEPFTVAWLDKTCRQVSIAIPPVMIDNDATKFTMKNVGPGGDLHVSAYRSGGPVRISSKQSAVDTRANPAEGKKGHKNVVSGVKIETLEEGSGSQKAGVNKKVWVSYVGRLINGKQFDHGNLDFRVGAGEMIKGFDLGVRGMRIKEKRRIIIPPRLGYGNERAGKIPPGSDLVFEVTMKKLQ